MTIDLTPEQVRWLGGLLRGFCSDPIYDMEDEQELTYRFMLLLQLEMSRGRDGMDVSPRQELQMWNELFEQRAAEKEADNNY